MKEQFEVSYSYLLRIGALNDQNVPHEMLIKYSQTLIKCEREEKRCRVIELPEELSIFHPEVKSIRT